MVSYYNQVYSRGFLDIKEITSKHKKSIKCHSLCFNYRINYSFDKQGEHINGFRFIERFSQSKKLV